MVRARGSIRRTRWGGRARTATRKFTAATVQPVVRCNGERGAGLNRNEQRSDGGWGNETARRMGSDVRYRCVLAQCGAGSAQRAGSSGSHSAEGPGSSRARALLVVPRRGRGRRALLPQQSATQRLGLSRAEKPGQVL